MPYVVKILYYIVLYIIHPIFVICYKNNKSSKIHKPTKYFLKKINRPVKTSTRKKTKMHHPYKTPATTTIPTPTLDYLSRKKGLKPCFSRT